jgi:DNA-binding transcriptional LysR family regulator
MELRHLRYFIAVAEELNFRRAAEIVHVAQPALSQQIKQLEDELQVALFVRNRHKVALTAAGRTFYVSAQQILKEARQAMADARAVEHGEAGRMTLGFVSSAAISVLPAVLAFSRKQLPLAEIELKELPPGEQIEALYQGRLDLGLFHAQLEDPAFETAVVAREQLLAAVPSTSRYARHKRVDLREIARETVIIPARHATPGYFERARTAFQAAGILPERVYHTSLLQTGVLLVGAGLGCSLVPESFQRIKVQGVVYRPLTTTPPTIDLLAAWRRDNASPLLQRIVQEIQALSAAVLPPA